MSRFATRPEVAPRDGHRRPAAALALLAAAALVLPCMSAADPIAVINGLRVEGCGRQPAVAQRLRPSVVLDSAARELSGGRELESAIASVGYRAASASSYHVRGTTRDEDVSEVLERRFCRSIGDTRFEEIGVFVGDGELWLVLGAPQPDDPLLEAVAVETRVLELVNDARAKPRRCGRESFDAAAPLRLSAALTRAARAHSEDMADRGASGHEGSDGSQSGERIRRQGYAWRASAENVAAGQPTPEAVVEAWLSSAGHCANIMAPYFTEMGIAFALAPGEDPPIYWTQVFATPQVASGGGDTARGE